MLALQLYRQPRRRSLLATQRSQPARTPDRRRKRSPLRLQLTQIADNHNKHFRNPGAAVPSPKQQTERNEATELPLLRPQHAAWA